MPRPISMRETNCSVEGKWHLREKAARAAYQSEVAGVADPCDTQFCNLALAISGISGSDASETFTHLPNK